MPLLLPDLVYHAGSFRRDWGVEFDRESGRIVEVGPAPELLTRTTELERLPARALIPGFANAHSHAFQRMIRGRTQWREPDAERSDFWTWRQAMYAAALAVAPQDVFTIARFCFLEMLRAGFTSVGEFHYLHRDRAGEPYENPNELAHRVIAAAEEVGIRIALLNVCYARGGIDEELGAEQRRFATPELDTFLSDTDALRKAMRRKRRVSVGVAAHSIRAVPRDWLPTLRDWADANDAALHMHVSEQTAEVEACESAFGLRPVELLAEDGLLGDRFTAVHATHLTDAEVAELGSSGTVVCACPTTERDLGDGFLRGAELRAAGTRIAIGSDSQTIIDPFEEMRLIEYHERLRRRRRNVVVSDVDGREEGAAPLIEMAAAHGATSLRTGAGSIRAGTRADLVGVDLTHPVVAGWDDRTLAASLVFSAPAGAVSDVWVDGVRRVSDRNHALDGVAVITFRDVVRRLTA